MLRHTFAALAGALALAAVTPALAEEFEAESRSARSLGLDLGLGAGVGFAPTYEGADNYRATVFPIIKPSFGSGPSRVDFRALDDIRIDLFPASRFRFGPVIGYTFGRDEDDDARLRGLGDIDGGLVGGAFVGYDFISDEAAKLGVAVAYTTQFTGDAFEAARFGAAPGLTDDFGAEIDLGLSGAVALSDRLDLSGRAGAVHATDDYMDTHFGIVAAQSAASGLPVFDPDAGFKSAYVRADLGYRLTDRIRLQAGLGYARIIGDAADSPVVANRNQFDGQIGASYTLRF